MAEESEVGVRRRGRQEIARLAVLYRHHSATDQRTEIPPYGLLPFRSKRARPYLYSDGEIRSLLRATLDMPCRYEFGKLRPWIYYCLFGLLSGAATITTHK